VTVTSAVLYPVIVTVDGLVMVILIFDHSDRRYRLYGDRFLDVVRSLPQVQAWQEWTRS